MNHFVFESDFVFDTEGQTPSDVCVFRFSSRLESRSLVPMNRRLSPSWATAVQNISGKVCVCVGRGTESALCLRLIVNVCFSV